MKKEFSYGRTSNMSVLSIIACSMLEDELVYVLSKDSEIQQLIVVENKDSLRLLRKLKANNCNPRTAFLDRISMLLTEKSSSASGIFVKFFSFFSFLQKVYANKKSMKANNVTVVVNMLKLNLHTDLDLLKAEVYKNVREMASFSDNILIFYGTCGHALGKLDEDFAELECQLSFLKDKNGEIVEDCISLALGGNEAYARTMTEFRGMGTIYLTPMWASSWKGLKNEAGSPDFNKNYLKKPCYCIAAKVNTGLVNDQEFQENVKEFACSFNMKIVNLKGTVEIVEKSYKAALNSVTGSQVEN
jgi:hypothetical protein